MENTKISFWEFISTHKVVIPIIQRDYAQGRKGKEELRKVFLTNLKQALDNHLPNGEKYLKLDFVYGATDDKVLYPLDGQQRLTTLWLLHWYIALKAGVLNESNCDILKRFTYETRVSSREFCERMCNPHFFENYEDGSIVEYIEKQTWFYSVWKRDPTIQSMLRMLEGTKIQNKDGIDFVDGIEELFEDCTDRKTFVNYWELLTNNSPIVFYHLPLEKFGLSDDLYIKMNARGKQLSAFENFKADLVGFVKGQDGDEWKPFLDEGRGLPRKLDTVWTDIFWLKKNKKNRIDEIYFAFLIRFFWNELFNARNAEGNYILKVGDDVDSGGNKTASENKSLISYRIFNADNPQLYNNFEPYCYSEESIPLAFFRKLEKVLDGYSKLKNTMPTCTWDKSFRFIPEYKDNSTVYPLTQVQRVVFYAICKFFQDESNKMGEESTELRRWLRVVWNLVSDYKDGGSTPQIRNTTAMRRAMEYIGLLDSHNVYESLLDNNISNAESAFEVRWQNEIIKARKILNDDGSLRLYDGTNPDYSGWTWEDVIVETENFSFFRGTIHFLYTNEDGKEDWYNFDRKWKNATKLLLNTDNNWENICNLIGYVDINVLNNYHDWYTANADFWRKWLFDTTKSFIIHHFLMQDDFTQDTRLNKDLSEILLRTKTSMKILHDWKNCQMVVTNYARRNDVFNNGFVYVINTPRDYFIDNLLLRNNNVSKIKIADAWGDECIEENGNRHYRGLYVDFSYEGRIFRLYERNVVELQDDVENDSNILLKEDDDVESFNTKLEKYLRDTSAEKTIL